MTKSMKKAIALCLFSMGVVGLMAQSNEFKIDVQKTGAPIQSTMYGIFFEDINYGADGGLYAELVKNRSFEFENPFGGWTPFGNVSVQTQKPCFDRNPHYVRLSYEKELTGTGLDNEGFNGIGIREGEKYDFSLYARTRSGDAPVKLRINLVDSRNDLYEQKEIEVSGKEWKKYTVVLTPGATEARSRLRITMVTKGIVDLEHISLFPQKTFNNRPNGMRADLAQALKELKPGVFRRLHCGGNEQGYPLPVEKHGRSGREPSDQYQSMELYILAQKVSGLLSVLRLGLFRIFPIE